MSPEPRKRPPRKPKQKPQPKYPDLRAGLQRIHDEGYDVPDDNTHPSKAVQTPIYNEVLTEMLAATK